LREQQTDEYCQEQKEKVKDGTEADFSIDKGILSFGKENHNRRIVIPRTLVRTVIEYHHDKAYAGHHGITRTQDLIKQILLANTNDQGQQQVGITPVVGTQISMAATMPPPPTAQH
jgi:hypothetical protein